MKHIMAWVILAVSLSGASYAQTQPKQDYLISLTFADEAYTFYLKPGAYLQMAEPKMGMRGTYDLQRDALYIQAPNHPQTAVIRGQQVRAGGTGKVIVPQTVSLTNPPPTFQFAVSGGENQACLRGIADTPTQQATGLTLKHILTFTKSLYKLTKGQAQSTCNFTQLTVHTVGPDGQPQTWPDPFPILPRKMEMFEGQFAITQVQPLSQPLPPFNPPADVIPYDTAFRQHVIRQLGGHAVDADGNIIDLADLDRIMNGDPVELGFEDPPLELPDHVLNYTPPPPIDPTVEQPDPTLTLSPTIIE